MKPRAVIFDLDGTLVDSLADIGGAMNHALVHFGIVPHPISAYRYFVGEGVDTLVERAASQSPAELRQQILREYRQYYADHSTDLTVPFQGIHDLLGHLRQRNAPLAVLSNKPQDATQRLVSHFFGESVFQVVFGERVGIPKKPDPTAALEIARHLQVDPAETLFLGDTGIDIKTAVAAGMQPIGVLWGMRDQAELTQAGATRVIRHPSELRLD